MKPQAALCALIALTLTPAFGQERGAALPAETQGAETQGAERRRSEGGAAPAASPRLAALLGDLSGSSSVKRLFGGISGLDGLRVSGAEIQATLRGLPSRLVVSPIRRALSGIEGLAVRAGVIDMRRSEPLRLRHPRGEVCFATHSRFTFRDGQFVPYRGVEQLDLLGRPQRHGASQRLRGLLGLGGGAAPAAARPSLLVPNAPASGGQSGEPLAPESVPAGGIELEQLREIMPGLSAEQAAAVLPYLNRALVEAEINTPLRQAAFLAQVAHESTDLTDWVEQGGRSYFNRYEPGTRPGRRVGNTQRGDGYRFRGRGPLQLTGRDNYTRAGRDLGLDLVGDPDQVATPEVGFRTSAWYWNQRNLNRIADRGDFRLLTRRVNGGLNHYSERAAIYVRARRVLGVGQ